ncbi:pyridoxamine 5'-phosphate oxidase family protein [Streptomyces sp. NPDC059720]|uniref:pyridoxamine 5'-phosphate oxidase family protein n=1 Tax=Streptomyces sp. NPDC059720 TaxID=3346924 RepID=UPI0036AB66DA
MDTYRPGSRQVQQWLGLTEVADHVGRSIGSGIKPVAAAFLELQPMLVIGAADENGEVWASLLTGPAGFVRATGPTSVSVLGEPSAGDPLAKVLAQEGTAVGTLALDPRTRRRMRLNGTARPTARGIAVEARQVFANCPKHIRRRDLLHPAASQEETAPGARGSTALTQEQRAFVSAADTFFIATVSPDGAEASHRGGDAGFVRAESAHEIVWPDYAGNAMFLTLGNLVTDSRAGLLFLDWTTGRTLQVTGSARIDFTEDGSRCVRFTVGAVVDSPRATGLRWKDA